MAKLFQDKEIDGKGRGCMATKNIKMGTVILKETPQLPISLYNEVGEIIWSPKSIMDLLQSFNNMNIIDKIEYLNLHDKFENLHDLPLEQKLKLKNCLEERIWNICHMEQIKHKAEKMLKIFNIYETNSFATGVCLKLSRFNHSCRPNAMVDQRNNVPASSSQTGMCIFSTIFVILF